MSLEDRTRVEEALRRIDELVAGLGRVADPAAGESARDLLQAVLDLHGLALARMMALVAAAPDGPALLDRLAADEQVAAVLLLYGLHPDDPATRIRRVLDAMLPRLHAAGIVVTGIAVTGRSAQVRLLGEEDAGLRHEIEEAVVNAAPDLDDIALDWLETADAEESAAAD